MVTIGHFRSSIENAGKWLCAQRFAGSSNSSKQPAIGRGHRHGQRTPKVDAHGVHRHTPLPPRAQLVRLEARRTLVRFQRPEGPSPPLMPWHHLVACRHFHVASCSGSEEPEALSVTDSRREIPRPVRKERGLRATRAGIIVGSNRPCTRREPYMETLIAMPMPGYLWLYM